MLGKRQPAKDKHGGGGRFSKPAHTHPSGLWFAALRTVLPQYEALECMCLSVSVSVPAFCAEARCPLCVSACPDFGCVQVTIRVKPRPTISASQGALASSPAKTKERASGELLVTGVLDKQARWVS